MAVRTAGDPRRIDLDEASLAGRTRATTLWPRRSVGIYSLGDFGLLRNGRVVPAADWQSKKSRDLLKLLVAKRGRPIHREAIIEILWEGERASGASNRLSIAMSRARSTLDPTRRFPAEHFITVSDDAVSLDHRHIDVDVERFLTLTGRGFLARRAGRGDAEVILQTACQLYGGDFLEDSAYEDWALPLREEARSAYIGAACVLGDLACSRREYETAVRYYSRVLEKDPWAEGAHLGMVRSALVVGRHGEARRHYAAYARRMAELELEAAAFPSLRFDDRPARDDLIDLWA